MAPTVFFQSKLPKELQCGMWVKLKFQYFPVVVLHIEKIKWNKLVGFDIMTCKPLALPIGGDYVVTHPEHNWWVIQYDTLTEKEVRELVQARQKKLNDLLIELERQTDTLETLSLEYHRDSPEALKKYFPSKAA